jgi:hypothetical protein
MDFIFIEDMRVEAHVGIYPRERAAPQTLEISLTFGVPDEAARDDDIARPSTTPWSSTACARNSRRATSTCSKPSANT